MTMIDHSLAREFDRLPPHSIDAEKCLLSSMMLDKDVIGEVGQIIDRDAFFQADHQVIFDVLLKMHRANRPVDAILLREELGKRQLLEEVGGNEYLGEILNTMPSAAHAMYYARVVAEKAKLRRIIEACNDGIRACYAPSGSEDPAGDIAARLERASVAVRETGHADTIQTIERAVHDVLEAKSSKTATRLYTGLTEIDVLCGGVPLSLFTTVAGKAGMGKSQLCKQIARNIAAGIPARTWHQADAFGDPTYLELGAQPGWPVGIITIEENAPKIATNYLAGESGVVNDRIVYNRLSADDWASLTDAVPRLAALPIFIDDAQRKLSDIVRVAKRMVRKHGVRAIVVDHLHLVDGETHANREQELSQISGGLKALFKELRVSGIVAQQMNRGGNADRGTPPELDHLRGTGTLEADGDLIMQLNRDDYFNWKKDGFVPNHRLDIYVNKNKDGAVGMRHAYFDGDSQTVTDWNGGGGPRGAAHAPAPRQSAPVPTFDHGDLY